MRASTKCDGPEGAETAIVTSGPWLLSSDPCSVAIRVATRAECRSLPDADQVERTLHLLRRNLPIGGFGRLGYEDVLCSNVDQSVVTWMATLEVDSVAFIDSATGLGDLRSIESCGLQDVSARCPLPFAFAR